MSRISLPPVPVVVGVMVVVTSEKVKVVTEDVILAKPLLAIFTVNVYVPTGFRPFNNKTSRL